MPTMPMSGAPANAMKRCARIPTTTPCRSNMRPPSPATSHRAANGAASSSTTPSGKNSPSTTSNGSIPPSPAASKKYSSSTSRTSFSNSSAPLFSRFPFVIIFRQTGARAPASEGCQGPISAETRAPGAVIGSWRTHCHKKPPLRPLPGRCLCACLAKARRGILLFFSGLEKTISDRAIFLGLVKSL